MERGQKSEWAEAQSIVVSVDLIAAAKNQLKFLSAVDRNRCLYEGPTIKRAIYRYNAYWLPLLATHLKNPVSNDPLVVPLDCEWIWHCHRLNPNRYKFDCEKLFGRVLGNHNVISSVQGTSTTKTKEIWNTMYPEEPYELDHSKHVQDVLQKSVQSKNFTSYDLVSAVGRQVSFYYQVSRPHVYDDDVFLKEAFDRYKGFLHLIRTNKRKNINRFCVPTYDIDLMWHSHQLNPVSYCNDLTKLLGLVLQHDDTDSDRSKGKKLDTGFFETTNQWMETFGLNYWKAGAMHRRTIPTPVSHIPFPFIYAGKKVHAPDSCDNLISLSRKNVVEVLLEFVDIKNVPEANKGSLHVVFSKKDHDTVFSGKRKLTVLSESKEKHVASFLCEPTGEFLLEIMYNFSSDSALPESENLFGSSSLSFQDFASGSKLFLNKWLPVVPAPGILASEPISIHVSLSFTPPTPAPLVFHMPLPKTWNVKHVDSPTRVTDVDGNEVLNLQMRDYSKELTKSTIDLLKEVVHITNSSEIHTLAEFHGTEWVIKGCGSMKLHCSTSQDDDQLFELVGEKMVRIFAGRKLEYEPINNKSTRINEHYMTVVEFSVEYPYGRAVALLDFKHGIIEFIDEWMIPTGITLAFILFDAFKTKSQLNSKEGCEHNMLSQAIDASSPTENSIRIQGMVNDTNAKSRKQGHSKSGGHEIGLGVGGGSTLAYAGCNGDFYNGCVDMIRSGRLGVIYDEMTDTSSGCLGCAGTCGTDLPKVKPSIEMTDTSSGCLGCAGTCGTDSPMVKPSIETTNTSSGCLGCAGTCGTDLPMVKAFVEMEDTSSGCLGCAGTCGTDLSMVKPCIEMADCGSGCLGCAGTCGTDLPMVKAFVEMTDCSSADYKGGCLGCAGTCGTDLLTTKPSIEMVDCQSGPSLACGGLYGVILPTTTPSIAMSNFSAYDSVGCVDTCEHSMPMIKQSIVSESVASA